MTLLAGTAADARVPNLGASGAIAAVLGAYFVLYPELAGPRRWSAIFPVRLSAWFFLGFWFLYQLVRGELRPLRRSANGGGVAFFAHVGGFVFGVAVAELLRNSGRVGAGGRSALRAPA